MSREMLQLAEALASEKNVDTEVVFQALEFALSTAAKKKANREHMDVRVEIDRDTGEYRTFRRWLIVADEDYTYPDVEKTIEEIQEEIPGTEIQIGEYYEEQLENEGFGRQAAQTAKQIILQRIRDAEREQILNEFLARKEDIVSGTVKRVERHGIIVEVVSGKLDALIPRGQMIPRRCTRSGAAGESSRKSQRSTYRSAGYLHRRTRFARERRQQRVIRRTYRRGIVVAGDGTVRD